MVQPYHLPGAKQASERREPCQPILTGRKRIMILLNMMGPQLKKITAINAPFIKLVQLTEFSIVVARYLIYSSPYAQAVIKSSRMRKNVRLVLDNLNTHTVSAFYEAFLPEEAHRLANRIGWVDTPKQKSWLNIAEIEFSVLKRQCLNRRIPVKDMLRQELAAWQQDRNNGARNITWQFTPPDA